MSENRRFQFPFPKNFKPKTWVIDIGKFIECFNIKTRLIWKLTPCNVYNLCSGGKLPVTWYPEDYVSKIPMTDMAMRPDPSRGYPGRTYRFYKGPVVFPFGFGLSYTQFSQSLAQAPTKAQVSLANTIYSNKNTTTLNNNAIRVVHANCDAPSLSLHLDVKNTGKVDGSHTVLVFSSPPEGKWGSEKRLVAFKKVHVLAGSQQRIKMNIHVCKHLSVVDEFGTRRIPVGKHTLHIGDDIKHQVSLELAL